MSELLPCPFCGGTHAEVINDHQECLEKWGEEFDEAGLGASDYRAVVCNFNEGGCGAVSGWRETEAEAIGVWNTRAERTCEVFGTINWEWTGPTTYFEHELSCGHVITSVDEEPPKFCEECGARVVSE